MEFYVHAGMQIFRREATNRTRLAEMIMELSLQFGYGMMGHTRTLIEAWGGGSVVLSPRDMTDAQLRSLASEVCALGGEPLLDPQFYLPHADHARLKSHEYWPSTFEESHSLEPEDWRRLIERLISLQQGMRCGRWILPGVLAESRQGLDSWLGQEEILIQEADALGVMGPDVMLTVALADSVVMSDDAIDQVLDLIASANVGWVYLVAQHPDGQYLVDDPVWLGNLLDLVAGIRLLGKRVLVGYCQHQMLILGAAGANAIASGTWMNVRSFPPEKFRASYDDEIRKRKTWYYSPDALSEYGIPYLDVAAKAGALDLLRPQEVYPQEYVEKLFQSPQPSAVRFGESEAFRHYLECLSVQSKAWSGPSFDETVEYAVNAVRRAEDIVSELGGFGVRGQNREFSIDVSQATSAALIMLVKNRGAVLRRNWDAVSGSVD